ncbi:MAG: hypothetical protein Q7J42_10390 [Sulfuritalea sp.]|nr:hypothetical protein [Sulfuritalea sp.]
MTRIITVIFITALLGGCMVVPLDYGYRGSGYQRWDNHHNRGDHSRNSRYQDRR